MDSIFEIIKSPVLLGLIILLISFILLKFVLNRDFIKKKAALNMPFYKIIYTDQKDENKRDDVEYSKILYSSKYDIQGKPDYIFKHKIKNDMVPVEIKSGMINDENMPHKGDLMQLTAYFIIVKEIYGVKPKYGYIMYKDFMFKIKNTYTLRKKLIKTLKMMRGMLKGNNINVDANFVTCRYCVCNGTVCEFCKSKKRKG